MEVRGRGSLYGDAYNCLQLFFFYTPNSSQVNSKLDIQEPETFILHLNYVCTRPVTLPIQHVYNTCLRLFGKINTDVKR